MIDSTVGRAEYCIVGMERVFFSDPTGYMEIQRSKSITVSSLWNAIVFIPKTAKK